MGFEISKVIFIFFFFFNWTNQKNIKFPNLTVKKIYCGTLMCSNAVFIRKLSA